MLNSKISEKTSSPKRKRTTTATKIKLKTMKTKSRTVAPPSSAIDEHLNFFAQKRGLCDVP